MSPANALTKCLSLLGESGLLRDNQMDHAALHLPVNLAPNIDTDEDFLEPLAYGLEKLNNAHILNLENYCSLIKSMSGSPHDIEESDMDFITNAIIFMYQTAHPQSGSSIGEDSGNNEPNESKSGPSP